jgi:hypothetical protein
VSKSFLVNLPISLGQMPPEMLDEIAELGRRLWASSLEQPVTATNRGRRTVAFPPNADHVLLRDLDHAISLAISLGDEMAAVDLATWYRALIVVDGTDQRRRRMLSLRRSPC